MTQPLCGAPWDGVVVHHSGSVTPCSMICHRACSGSLDLGHLDHTPLEEILDGPAARSLRERLLAGDTEGLCCSHCDKAGTCNLYGDPVGGVAASAREQAAGPGLLDTSARPPTRLELGITDLCNMRCQMCALTLGIASPPGQPVRGFMPLERVIHCLDELTRRATGTLQVWLHWIGEPLLHPDLLAICRAAAERGCSLFLVTNGIELDPALSERLLELPGRHSLSVSLNAWSEPTFSVVNGSPQRDRVFANTMAFLDARMGREAGWDVIVTSVVLADNLHELPRFVQGWREHFERRGYRPDLVANGRPARAAEQIMLLAEVDWPQSPALFREALRSVGLHDPDVPTEGWESFDRVIRAGLGHPVTRPWPGELAALSAQALRASPKERGLLVRGLTALGEGELALAIACGDDSDELLEWLLERGEHERVRAALDRAGLDRPLTARQAWLRGRALLWGQAPTLALGDLEQAAEDSDLRPWVAQHLAGALLELDRPTEALEILRHAEDEPSIPQLRWRALVQASLPPPPGAPPPGAMDALARVALDRQARGDDASELLELLLEQDPQHPIALYARGSQALRSGRYPSARADLERALEAPPHDLRAPIHQGLAALALRTDQPGPALEHAEAALGLAPTDPYTHQLVWEAGVMAACSSGDLALARATLEAVLPALTPALLGPWAAALFRLHAAGDAPAVVALATAALRDQRDHAFVRWLRGAASEARGDLRAARADLEACLQADPAQLAPIEAAVQDSLATLNRREGRREEANRCARRALELEPGREATRALLEELGG